MVAGLSLTWVLYSRILPTEGTLGFIVCWWLAFTAFYTLITGLRRGRVVLADRFAVIVAHSAAGLVGIALTSVIGYTLYRGAAALTHKNFFTTDLSTAGPLEPLSTGGALHALAGTLIQISIAIAVTLPLGVLCAVYLTEVGGRAAKFVRSVVEAMTALPSIVAGLFAYVVLLIGLGMRLSGFVAAMALSVMMLPIIARSAEVVLRLVRVVCARRRWPLARPNGALSGPSFCRRPARAWPPRWCSAPPAVSAKRPRCCSRPASRRT